MQTIANKSALRSTSARPARATRSTVVVRASVDESRRAVLTGFVAGVATLSTAGSALAVATAVDLFDDRKARETGYDLIYEARDVDLSQAQRDGLSQSRAGLEETLARVKLSEKRIDNDVEPYIQKSYWVLAREQLRNQVGTLRFDLNVLADVKPKEQRKKAQELKKAFITKIEDLDFALRSKDKTDALAKLTVAQDGLDQVLASLV